MESDQPLGELIWDLGRAYYAYVGLAERVLVDANLGHVIRPGMGHVLFALYEEDGCTIKEIAARSQLANSTLTGLLNRMEQVGLIKRERDEQDGRLVRVRLTPRARELESKCRAMLRQVTRVAQKGIGEKNVPLANDLLEGLTSAFREEERRLAQKQSDPKATALRE
jgi:MarR family transcriptional regulator, organic hydroperoxide resistance regulator